MTKRKIRHIDSTVVRLFNMIMPRTWGYVEPVRVGQNVDDYVVLHWKAPKVKCDHGFY